MLIHESMSAYMYLYEGTIVPLSSIPHYYDSLALHQNVRDEVVLAFLGFHYRLSYLRC